MMHFISKEEKKEKTKGNIYEGVFLFLFFVLFLTFSSSLKRQFTTVILIMPNGLGT